MKALALINNNFSDIPGIETLGNVNVAGIDVNCGLIDVPRPHFDPQHKQNDGYVLVKVTAFSCNYRDKGLILKSVQKMTGDFGNSAMPVSFFGSDFVGEVVDKGRDVTEFEIGDRVIPDCSYPEMPAEGIPAGVVTNEASRGWLRLHHSRLAKIPDSMSDAIAAGYTIGAQTSSSMIRKASVKKDDDVLITSGRSNTSIFITRKLLARGIVPDVLSTSEWSEDEKEYIAPANIIKVERGNENWNKALNKKYDVIFDPFFDLHLYKAVDHLDYYGRYITCGLKNQHENFAENTDHSDNGDLMKVMLKTMVGDISIIGNCIGTKDDLQDAINTLEKDPEPIPLYESLSPDDGLLFVDLTYNLKRLGKVVMEYK